MKPRADLARLAGLADLMLDQRLASLRAAAAARAQSEARLAGLAAAPAPDLGPVVGVTVALAYDRWADARRAEINLTLARQTVEWIDARDGAALAFGRSEVLRKLRDR